MDERSWFFRHWRKATAWHLRTHLATRLHCRFNISWNGLRIFQKDLISFKHVCFSHDISVKTAALPLQPIKTYGLSALSGLNLNTVDEYVLVFSIYLMTFVSLVIYNTLSIPQAHCLYPLLFTQACPIIPSFWTYDWRFIPSNSLQRNIWLKLFVKLSKRSNKVPREVYIWHYFTRTVIVRGIWIECRNFDRTEGQEMVVGKKKKNHFGVLLGKLWQIQTEIAS